MTMMNNLRFMLGCAIAGGAFCSPAQEAAGPELETEPDGGSPIRRLSPNVEEPAAEPDGGTSHHTPGIRPQLMPAAEVNQYELRMRLFSDAAYGLPFGGDVEHVHTYRTGVSVPTEKGNEAFLYLGGVDLDLVAGSELDLLISNPREFELGVGWRGFVAPDKYWFNPYYTLALEFGAVAYRYRVPTPGGPNEGDHIATLGGHAGLGLMMNRGGGLNAFAEVTIGGTMLYDETAEPYVNDFFDNHAHMLFRAGLSWSF